MTNYPEILAGRIKIQGRHKWLVTGAAGFIGSHLSEALLSLGQSVTGLDDLSTGHRENLPASPDFAFVEGSLTDINTCRETVRGCDYVLHHAALASVPESMKEPVKYHDVNVSGFVNILQASRENGIKRVVYASSSAVYGDNETMPKTEKDTGRELSPYALTKYMNEEYAEFFSRVYGLECVGLRYFNVFGARQDPSGAYAAVIPKWISAVKSGKIPVIFGDGTQTRDFCPVQNIVAANMLAAFSDDVSGRVFNIGCGERISLNELLRKIYAVFAPEREVKAVHENAREGDILHSSASIELARKALKYEPVIYLEEGLRLYDNQA